MNIELKERSRDDLLEIISAKDMKITMQKIEIERLNNIIKDIKNQLDYLETYSSKEDVFEDMKRRLDRIDKIIGTDLYYSQEFVDDRISELKEADKEIERLNKELENLEKLNNANYQSFIETNKIIIELEKWLVEWREMLDCPDFYEEGIIDCINDTLTKLQELKGSDK